MKTTLILYDFNLEWVLVLFGNHNVENTPMLGLLIMVNSKDHCTMDFKIHGFKSKLIWMII